MKRKDPSPIMLSPMVIVFVRIAHRESPGFRERFGDVE
jgi:hypothetical protein